MNIRKRITLLFIGLVVIILGISSISTYLISENHRYEDFHNRLANKAINTANLLIQVEEVDANLLEKIEQDNPTSLPHEIIRIYNYRNEILYSSDAANRIPVTRQLLDEIRLEQEVRFAFSGFEAIGLLYADRFDRFVVIAAAKDTFGKRKIRALGNILTITFVISVLLVSVAGWFYSGRVLKPMSRVVDQVEKISELSLNVRVDEANRTDEIGRLAMTFNQMLARLEKAFSAQKNFIANASHELRTPLTAITGKIEVQLMQERSVDQYRETLQSLLLDVRSLNQLSNRLLMLAQTTAEGAAKLQRTLRVDELLWQAKDVVMNFSSHYRVLLDLDLELDDESLTIHGDGQLLRASMVNLMDNACKYSPDHTAKVTVRPSGEEIMIAFTDNGPGILPEDQPHIFEPFYRGKNIVGVSGHGIGLSLVSRIIGLHHGRLDFNSTADNGTSFRIFLPIRRI